MTKVSTALCTERFGPHHSVAYIALRRNSIFAQRFCEAWPPRAAVVLRVAGEEGLITHNAVVRAFGLCVVVLAREGTLGTRFLCDVVLGWCQTFPEVLLVSHVLHRSPR